MGRFIVVAFLAAMLLLPSFRTRGNNFLLVRLFVAVPVLLLLAFIARVSAAPALVDSFYAFASTLLAYRRYVSLILVSATAGWDPR